MANQKRVKYVASRVPFAYPWYPTEAADRQKYCASHKNKMAQRPTHPRRQSSTGSQHHRVSSSKSAVMETATVEYEVPDGGYGWVVVMTAFVFISLPMGISASFAIYYEEWLDYFHAGKVRTSLVGSVGSGCVPLLGSLGGMILTNLFDDIRLVGITGCLVASVGFILSYFVQDITVLALTYGALGGFGMGLMFNCAYLSVGYYFDKNRSFATAIASSGTGFGTLISRVIRAVIIEYGWRGSLLIIAAICIQCVVFGMLIRPLYAKKVPKKPVMSDVEEVVPKTVVTETLPPDKKRDTPANDDVNATRNMFSSHDGVFRPRRQSFHNKNAFSSHMHISHKINSNKLSALTATKGDVKLSPYDRQDIFFEGSSYDIAQLDRANSVDVPDSNRNQFISQITIDDVPINLTGCDKIKDNLKRSFSLNIFKHPTFCLVVLAMTLHHCAFFIPYTYIISLAKDKGIPKSTSEYLIICFGMSNFVNKLWIGRVMTWFKVEQLYVVCTTLVIGAIAATLATFCQEFYQFVLVAILYGGSSPIVTIYVTNILVKYLGIANLTNAFSIVTIIRGLGSLSGPPLAGYVIEQTGMTRSAFYVGSTADVLSACFFGLILFINRKHITKEVKLSEEEQPINEHTEDPAPKEMDTLAGPKVIVTVPTAEGNLDKLIHYSNECFDNLAAQDQKDHAKRMKQKLRDSVYS